MIPLRILWLATPRWVKLAGIAAIVIAWAFLAGRAWERQSAALDAARAAIETHERIHDADPGSLDGASDDDVDGILRTLSE